MLIIRKHLLILNLRFCTGTNSLDGTDIILPNIQSWNTKGKKKNIILQAKISLYQLQYGGFIIQFCWSVSWFIKFVQVIFSCAGIFLTLSQCSQLPRMYFYITYRYRSNANMEIHETCATSLGFTVNASASIFYTYMAEINIRISEWISYKHVNESKWKQWFE